MQNPTGLYFVVRLSCTLIECNRDGKIARMCRTSKGAYPAAPPIKSQLRARDGEADRATRRDGGIGDVAFGKAGRLSRARRRGLALGTFWGVATGKGFGARDCGFLPKGADNVAHSRRPAPDGMPRRGR